MYQGFGVNNRRRGNEHVEKRYIGTIDNNQFFVQAEGEKVIGILQNASGNEVALSFINSNNNNGGTFYLKLSPAQEEYTVAEVARLFDQNKALILSKVLEKTMI
jgi:hypothetical protein